MPPGIVVWLLLVLIGSQLSYAFWPHRSRSYLAILLLAAAGFALGQLWDFLGLPSLRVGEANLLPGALFAAALQFLVPFLPITFPKGNREP